MRDITQKIKDFICFPQHIISIFILKWYLHQHTEDIKNAFWYIECFYWGTRKYRVRDDPYLGEIYAKKN